MNVPISRRRVLQGGLLFTAGLGAGWPSTQAAASNAAIAVYRSQAAAQLHIALAIGEKVLHELSQPDAAERLQGILAELSRMLESAKLASTNLKHARSLMTFKDPLADFQIRKTDHTFGLIRHGLDHTNLPWEQYLAEVMLKLAEAVATLRQVLELIL